MHYIIFILYSLLSIYSLNLLIFHNQILGCLLFYIRLKCFCILPTISVQYLIRKSKTSDFFFLPYARVIVEQIMMSFNTFDSPPSLSSIIYSLFGFDESVEIDKVSISTRILRLHFGLSWLNLFLRNETEKSE